MNNDIARCSGTEHPNCKDCARKWAALNMQANERTWWVMTPIGADGGLCELKVKVQLQ
jgi:hypothetical protein